MLNYIKLIRPKHYIKNLLIFIPLIFSGQFFKSDNFIMTFIGFISFCLIASSIYIFNDIMDKEKDMKHETKKNRPIASGSVSVFKAKILIVVFCVISFLLLLIFKIPIVSMVLLLSYLIINILYSLGLKNIPILDVAIIVAGFVIRVLYGASILSIVVSNWLYLTIVTISFYLSLGKRRNEINKSGSQARNVLKYYNKEFLDKNMYMCLSMSIIFYSLWTIDNTIMGHYHNFLIWTVPLVIIISMRYSMNIEKNNFGDPTEVILNDKVIILLFLILSLSVFTILYL